MTTHPPPVRLPDFDPAEMRSYRCCCGGYVVADRRHAGQAVARHYQSREHRMHDEAACENRDRRE